MSIRRTWVRRGKTTVTVFQTAEPSAGGRIDDVELTYPGVVNAARDRRETEGAAKETLFTHTVDLLLVAEANEDLLPEQS